MRHKILQWLITKCLLRAVKIICLNAKLEGQLVAANMET